MTQTLFHETVSCFKEYLSILKPEHIDCIGLTQKKKEDFLKSRFNETQVKLGFSGGVFAYRYGESDAENAYFYMLAEKEYWGSKKDYVKISLHELGHRVNQLSNLEAFLLKCGTPASFITKIAAGVFGMAAAASELKTDPKIRRRQFLQNIAGFGCSIAASHIFVRPSQEHENKSDVFSDAVMPEHPFSLRTLIQKESDRPGPVEIILEECENAFSGSHPTINSIVRHSEKRCKENLAKAQAVNLPSFSKMMFGA